MATGKTELVTRVAPTYIGPVTCCGEDMVHVDTGVAADGGRVETIACAPLRAEGCGKVRVRRLVFVAEKRA